MVLLAHALPLLHLIVAGNLTCGLRCVSILIMRWLFGRRIGLEKASSGRPGGGWDGLRGVELVLLATAATARGHAALALSENFLMVQSGPNAIDGLLMFAIWGNA